MSISAAFKALRASILSTPVRAITVVGALAVGMAGFAQPASAQFRQEDFALRLSGFAQNDVEFNGLVANLSGSLGYFFTDQFEAGLRQDLTYSDIGGKTIAAGTALFVNYHLGDVGSELQPFIGASLGYNYGDNVNETFYAGPEGGLKYFFQNSDWFLVGSVEYQFFFEDAGGADDNFDDGTFVYRLGLGVLL